MATEHRTEGRDTNPDPITGEPGSHPVGTGVGAAGGGTTGAMIGMAVGGPVGGAVGAVIGAIAGGLAGKSVAEGIDPTVEESYWREHHGAQPFANQNHDFETYAPAYRSGYEGATRHEPGTRFEDAEQTLRQDYETRLASHQSDVAAGTTAGLPTSSTPASTTPGKAHLPWDEAKHAAKAAWTRVESGGARNAPPR